MPLDPMIANPATLKLDDPMEKYGQYLQNALAMDKIAEMGRERQNAMAANNYYKTAWTEKGLDKNIRDRSFALGGHGSMLPEVWKKDAEIDKLKSESAENQATATKTGAESVKVALENFTKNLPLVTTPQQYIDFASKDEILGKYFSERGITLDKLSAALSKMTPEQFNGFKEAQLLGAEGLKNQYELVKTETGQQLVALPASGTTRNPRVVGTYGPAPEKGTTVNIDNRTASKYADILAELQAKEDFEKGLKAAAAPRILEDVNRALGLVDKARTGFFANPLATFDSATTSLGASDPNGVVQATQELGQILSTDMLKNIGTLRTEFEVKLGSVTEKEFAQLQNTMPKITDSPATIKAWLQRLATTTRRAQQEYEQRHSNASGSPVTGPAVKGLAIPAPPKLPPAALPTFKDKAGRTVRASDVQALMEDHSPAEMADFDRAYGEKGLAQRIIREVSQQGGAPFPAGAGAP